MPGLRTLFFRNIVFPSPATEPQFLKEVQFFYRSERRSEHASPFFRVVLKKTIKSGGKMRSRDTRLDREILIGPPHDLQEANQPRRSFFPQIGS